MINGRYGGRRNRYSYNALPAKGWFGFEGLVKQDLESGAEEVVELPQGVYASETVMAPRIGSSAEDGTERTPDNDVTTVSSDRLLTS